MNFYEFVSKNLVEIGLIVTLIGILYARPQSRVARSVEFADRCVVDILFRERVIGKYRNNTFRDCYIARMKRILEIVSGIFGKEKDFTRALGLLSILAGSYSILFIAIAFGIFYFKDVERESFIITNNQFFHFYITEGSGLSLQFGIIAAIFFVLNVIFLLWACICANKFLSKVREIASSVLILQLYMRFIGVYGSKKSFNYEVMISTSAMVVLSVAIIYVFVIFYTSHLSVNYASILEFLLFYLSEFGVMAILFGFFMAFYMTSIMISVFFMIFSMFHLIVMAALMPIYLMSVFRKEMFWYSVAVMCFWCYYAYLDFPIAILVCVVFIYSLINSCFDFVSLLFSRVLARHVLIDYSLKTLIIFGVFDLVLACVLLLSILFLMTLIPYSLHNLFGFLPSSVVFTQNMWQPIIDFDQMPVYWVLVLAFSTLVPTLAHLGIVVTLILDTTVFSYRNILSRDLAALKDDELERIFRLFYVERSKSRSKLYGGLTTMVLLLFLMI